MSWSVDQFILLHVFEFLPSGNWSLGPRSLLAHCGRILVLPVTVLL